MTAPATETDAQVLRAHLARALADQGVLPDPAWRAAVETVPRHRFVPGFYQATDHTSPEGLTLWQPVTAASDYGRWLAAAYSDDTLITQFDGTEPDWDQAVRRAGGAPSSSSTLPSLVLQMWNDADISQDDEVLEVGTGTGYSTAVACERLGSARVTSIEVDGRRLQQAGEALYSLGYTPDLAVADGLYGYRPSAPFDRIVAACSFRAVPGPWLPQTRPGGKILTTLGGWLHGHARVLLTVNGDGTADGSLLPGTVSFMAARAQEAPAFGNPAHWAALLGTTGRPARHHPDRITAGTAEAFFTRFLVQCAIPDTQLSQQNDTMFLVDIVSGSVAQLTPAGEGWTVREGGPRRLWEKAETALDAYDHADCPPPETFRLEIDPAGQYLRHPRMPELHLARG